MKFYPIELRVLSPRPRQLMIHGPVIHGPVFHFILPREFDKDENMNPNDLLTDPNQFLYGLDFESGTVQFVELTREPYRTGMSKPYSYPMEMLFSLLASEDREKLSVKPLPISHYIFMTDFCGSTLLSNALGRLEEIFWCGERLALSQLGQEKFRPPPSSRVIASRQVGWDQLQALVMRFQAKTASVGQVALFKEWGPGNFIIREQLKADAHSRAIFMYSTLEEYLTASLKEQRRRKLARMRVEGAFTGFELLEPLRGMQRRGLQDHEVCALHWLTLMYRYMTAEYCNLPGLLTLQSHDFFERPAETVARVAAHFGIPASDSELEQIINGPVFATHSKGVDRAFSMADRELANREARAKYQEAIVAGRRFADEIMARHPIPSYLPRDLFSQ